MKNFRYYSRASSVFFLLTLVSMQACKKDSDPSPSGANGVEGSWQLSAIKVSPAVDGITDYLAFLEAFTGSTCLKKITFIFNGDGTVSGATPQECQGTADDVADDVGISEQSTWKVEGSKLIITSGTDRTEYDLKVNKSTMEWSISEVDPDDGKTYTTTIVFNRV